MSLTAPAPEGAGASLLSGSPARMAAWRRSPFEIAFGKRLCEVRGPKADLASLHKARRAFLQDTRKAGMLYAWNSVPLLR